MADEARNNAKPLAVATKPIVFCVGSNHRTATAAVRESLYLSEKQLAGALLGARKDSFEVAALSTCNRFEVIGVCDSSDAHESKLLELVIELQQRAGNTSTVLQDIQSHLYFHTGEAAIAHVLRVVASLDSLVVGETQITGQFKDALELARRSETIGPILHRLGQDALATAKKIRSKTDIGRKPVSIGHAAVDLAAKVYGTISQHAVLILGAGEMASLAAKYLEHHAPKRLVIANRSAARAEELVRTLGYGETAPLSQLPQLLKECDIVIAATGAPRPIVMEDEVRLALSGRKGKPLLMIDISIPRNIDPDCGKPDDVFLFDIDDLKKVVDSNQKDRQEAAGKAEEYVTEGTAAFVQWLAALSVKPTLGKFRSYVDNLLRKESAKTFGREPLKGLTPEQLAAVQGLLDAVASRLSGDVSSRVLTPEADYYPEQLSDALSALFPLGDTDLRQQKGDGGKEDIK